VKVLVSGAKGFVGRNLVENLKNIKYGKDKTRAIQIEEIFEYDIDDSQSLLEMYCEKTDFIFHFAGVNRPKEETEFKVGNIDLVITLLDILKRHKNPAPIVMSSSIQAALIGRYQDSKYGKSKLEAENYLFQYAKETGNKVFIYRFPNLFGKWCKPNYNSVVATFCNAVANNLDYTINNEDTKLELLYIDDLVCGMLNVLEGYIHFCDYCGLNLIENPNGKYCFVPVTYQVTLKQIVDILQRFKEIPQTLEIPEMPMGSFEKKLYSTYLSYLPESSISYPIKRNIDNRGMFAELIKFGSFGQVSVNITKPGQRKGQHWHNSKCETFIVISGYGIIQQRQIGVDQNGNLYPIIEIEVKGEEIKAIQMLPGYTHNIINLSKTEDLVTIIWANEPFSKKNPDTFFEEV